MLEDKITTLRALIQRRDEIDKELAALTGESPEAPKRGRPRKNDGEGRAGSRASESEMEDQSTLPV